jgi:hypothetical protein
MTSMFPFFASLINVELPMQFTVIFNQSEQKQFVWNL